MNHPALVHSCSVAFSIRSCSRVFFFFGGGWVSCKTWHSESFLFYFVNGSFHSVLGSLLKSCLAQKWLQSFPLRCVIFSVTGTRLLRVKVSFWFDCFLRCRQFQDAALKSEGGGRNFYIFFILPPCKSHSAHTPHSCERQRPKTFLYQFVNMLFNTVKY